MIGGNKNYLYRQKVFDLEIDYYIVKCIKRGYELILTAPIKKRKLDFSFLLVSKKDIENFIKKADESHLFGGLLADDTQEKLLPEEYWESVGTYIANNLCKGKVRRRLHRKYSNISYQDSIAYIENMECLVQTIYKIYSSNLQKSIKLVNEEAKNENKIINLFAQNKEPKMIHPFVKMLKQLQVLVRDRMTLPDLYKNEFLMEWMNIRLINIYVDSLVHYMSEHQLFDDEEIQNALTYNIKEKNAQIESLDAWYIGKFAIDDLCEQIEVKKLDVFKSVIADPTYQQRITAFRQLTENNTVITEDNEEICELIQKIAEKVLILFDYFDAYDVSDLQDIGISDISDFEELMKMACIEQIRIGHGDKLDIETCNTIQIDETTIEKEDYTISYVFKKGFCRNSSIIRKTVVAVYRYKEYEGEELWEK